MKTWPEYNVLIETRDQIQKDIEAATLDLLKTEVRVILEKYPDMKSFGWTQSNAYNDENDYAVFRSGGFSSETIHINPEGPLGDGYSLANEDASEEGWEIGAASEIAAVMNRLDYKSLIDRYGADDDVIFECQTLIEEPAVA